MVQPRRARPSFKEKLARVATAALDTPAITASGKVLLRSNGLRRLAQREKWKLKLALGYRLVPEEALTEKFRDALLYLQRDKPDEANGDYLEFGVFNGTSLYCMHRVIDELGMQNIRLFGFDSFEGLPSSSSADEWQPGAYEIDYKFTRKWLTKRGIDWNRTTLVKGWFNETLNQTLIDRYRLQRASIVMFDCDAYESTRQALTFCGPLFGERAVLLFDDWHASDRARRGIGQKLALDEFLDANPQFTVEQFGSYGANSQVFKLLRSP